MKVTLSAPIKWAVSHMVGVKTAGIIFDTLEGGLADAIVALRKGDIAGFLAALPDDLAVKVKAHFEARNGQPTGLATAEIISAVRSAIMQSAMQTRADGASSASSAGGVSSR